MQSRQLGKTDLHVAPLIFGGNVLGWTIDEAQSFRVLDAFVDHGFNAIDTADRYSMWAPGNQGGESETIIGNWLKANPGKRDKVLIFTKIGSDLGKPGQKGLGKAWITEGVEYSLRRLGIDCIDLYFSHRPDDDTPHEETLSAYEALIKAGKVRYLGASNFTPTQLDNSLVAAKTKGLPRYDVLQPEYNLCDRASFDGALSELCMQEEIAVTTYYSLASGFLSGKYRSEDDVGKSARGKGIVEKYFNERGRRILAALDEIAAAHQVTPTEVSLAWLLAKENVTAPIVSATSVEHVERFVGAVNLKLSTDDMDQLEYASLVSM